jgi:uncharacterized protein
MRLIGRTIGSTHALGQLFSGKQAIGLDHIALAVDPFGLNRVQPGALRRQQEGQDTHACARLLDVLVVLTNPGANDLVIPYTCPHNTAFHMDSKIALSTHTSIDLPTLIDTRLLIQANSGGGKSWLIRRLLEQSHGKVQQLVIDLEGEFSTLRERFDYILADKNGDTPAEPRSAGLLGRRLLELNVSAIIDLYELPQQERKRFVKLFLEALVNVPKQLWHPVLVVIDEAHVFAPEKGQSEAMGAVIDLATRGRKRGYCAVLATQRLSKLHKDAAAECNNKLIGRTGLDIDRKRAAEELGFTSKEATLALRQLEPGEFFAFGPAISPEVTKVQIGSVTTSHPKAGDRILTEPTPPTATIKAILSKLADLPEAAATEAKTVEDLQARNRELQRKLTLAQRSHPAPTQEQIDRAVAEALTHKEQVLTEERQRAHHTEQALMQAQETLASIAALATGSNATLPQPTSPATPAPAAKQPAPSLPADKPIVGGALRMIQTLASRYPMTFTKSQLATLSKMSPRSGSYSTYLSLLKSKGFIQIENNQVSITDAGLEFAGAYPQEPQTQEQIIAMWRENLQGGARRMFDVLVSIYPASKTRDDLAFEAEMSPTSGSFSTYLSMLKSNGLIEVSGTDVKASDTLFINAHQ